jgi:hypothetical protein
VSVESQQSRQSHREIEAEGACLLCLIKAVESFENLQNETEQHFNSMQAASHKREKRDVALTAHFMSRALYTCSAYGSDMDLSVAHTTMSERMSLGGVQHHSVPVSLERVTACSAIFSSIMCSALSSKSGAIEGIPKNRYTYYHSQLRSEKERRKSGGMKKRHHFKAGQNRSEARVFGKRLCAAQHKLLQRQNLACTHAHASNRRHSALQCNEGLI